MWAGDASLNGGKRRNVVGMCRCIYWIKEKEGMGLLMHLIERGMCYVYWVVDAFLWVVEV